MPAGIRPPEAATVIVVLSPSMSNQMRCASASCRPPKPVPSIFSSRPATERSRSTGTGLVGMVRYLLGFGFRCVTISLSLQFKVSDAFLVNSLSLLGEGWGEGLTIVGNCFLCCFLAAPLTLALSHREREQDFSFMRC